MNIEVVRKKFRAKNNLHAKKEKKNALWWYICDIPCKKGFSCNFLFEVTENHCSVANRGSH